MQGVVDGGTAKTQFTSTLTFTSDTLVIVGTAP